MSVSDYSNIIPHARKGIIPRNTGSITTSGITYRITGMLVINNKKDKQEGILIHLQITNPADSIVYDKMTLFLDKHDCAHLAKTTNSGRKYWTRFRLPKMFEQTSAYCKTCGRQTPHNKIAGKWKCILHDW